MEKRILVIAQKGQICPKQGGGGMITDETPVLVPAYRYYRRLLAEKSLILPATAAPEPGISSAEAPAPAAASNGKRRQTEAKV